MGHASLSVLALVASFVLLMQVALHMELLEQKSGLGIDFNNLNASRYKVAPFPQLDRDTPTSSPPPKSNLRNKRFLHVPRTPLTIESASYDDTATKFTSESTIVKVIYKISGSTKGSKDYQSVVVEEANKVQNPWEGVSPDLQISRFYTGQFLEPNANLCSNNRKDLKLVVLVPSAITNFQQRDSVRKTWGTFALRKDVTIGFVLGNPQLSTASPTVLEIFRRENDIFGDMIVADMKDSYQNLTLKSLFMLQWTSTYCDTAKYMIKADDDMFLNIPLVLDFIAKEQERDEQVPKIYGNVFHGHMPQRNTSSKHHVKFDVYPHDMMYPDFTSGPAYLISTSVLKQLLQTAVRLPLFNLEDVFLTGFVASSLNIPRINMTEFRNELENPFNMPACKIVKTMAGMTDGSPAQKYYVWYNYLLGRSLCKYLKLR